jgi:hypothetical protein
VKVILHTCGDDVKEDIQAFQTLELDGGEGQLHIPDRKEFPVTI